MDAILSIHDVMPATLSRVEKILTNLRACKVPEEKIYLLVVPGLDWDIRQIHRLLDLQEQGYQLGGHGWVHHISRRNTLYHHLHSLFISRDVAEHLSLSAREIHSLIEDNFNWFRSHGFRDPELYVPPAWAMGGISRAELKSLPFRFYESSAGVLDVHADRYTPLALTGYEADCWWRTPVLKSWNGFNVHVLSRFNRVRISIHPYDFEYRVAGTILPHVTSARKFLSYADL